MVEPLRIRSAVKKRNVFKCVGSYSQQLPYLSSANNFTLFHLKGAGSKLLVLPPFFFSYVPLFVWLLVAAMEAL
jgi:hypothetical protein